MNVGGMVSLKYSLLFHLKGLSLTRGPVILSLNKLTVQHLHNAMRVGVVVNGTIITMIIIVSKEKEKKERKLQGGSGGNPRKRNLI